MQSRPESINPEHVVYWYFRLNGCFTFTNFFLHHQDTANTMTEFDLVAVRFPYRIELDKAPQGAMVDDPLFTELSNSGYVEVFIVDSKYTSSVPKPNPSWLRSDDVYREILKRTGVFPESEIVNNVAPALSGNGTYKDETRHIRVRVCIVAKTMGLVPKAQILSFEDTVLPFIYNRFRKYAPQKSNVGTWELGGRNLRRWVSQSDTLELFKARAISAMDKHIVPARQPR